MPACDITSVTSATLHTTQSPTKGRWQTLMKRSARVNFGFAELLLERSSSRVRQLGPAKAAPSDNYNLSVARRHRCGHPQGVSYYNKANSNLIKYDLQNKSVVLTSLQCGLPQHVQLSWGDTATLISWSSQGLWAIYATNLREVDRGLEVEPRNLAVTQSWTTSRMKNSSGNAFAVCGKLYVTSSYSQSNTTIAYKYDTKQAGG